MKELPLFDLKSTFLTKRLSLLMTWQSLQAYTKPSPIVYCSDTAYSAVVVKLTWKKACKDLASVAILNEVRSARKEWEISHLSVPTIPPPLPPRICCRYVQYVQCRGRPMNNCSGQRCPAVDNNSPLVVGYYTYIHSQKIYSWYALTPARTLWPPGPLHLLDWGTPPPPPSPEGVAFLSADLFRIPTFPQSDWEFCQILKKHLDLIKEMYVQLTLF